MIARAVGRREADEFLGAAERLDERLRTDRKWVAFG
jgi:hypothetical protein